MAHKVCHDIGNWVEQNVQQQVEQCMDQDCVWWCLCCNKWFCFLVWIIVVVTTWVIQTVCEIVADVVDLVVNIVRGIVDIVVGLFTGDWTRLAAGFGEIVGGIVNFVADIIPIVTLGTLVGAFDDSRSAWRLRNYAKGLLEDKYKQNSPEDFDSLSEALGLNSGGFGLRLKCRALRSFIRSDFSSKENQGVPDLIIWLTDPQLGLDLKSLAGFNPPEWWSRQWPEMIGDAGDISEADLENYIAKGGVGNDVKHFTLFSMSESDLQSRIDTASQHASEIGLILQWTVEDTRLEAGNQVIIDTCHFETILPHSPFNRHQDTLDPIDATKELCAPVSIAAFGFKGACGNNGTSAHMANSTCLEPYGDFGTTRFDGQHMTGTTFRYRKPDLIFKYVTIHEMGHSFGLCHVDGLLRIMYTAGQGISTKSSWWQYWTTGTEAGFIFEEGQKVWEYIVRNFAVECLKTRQF